MKRFLKFFSLTLVFVATLLLSQSTLVRPTTASCDPVSSLGCGPCPGPNGGLAPGKCIDYGSTIIYSDSCPTPPSGNYCVYMQNCTSNQEANCGGSGCPNTTCGPNYTCGGGGPAGYGCQAQSDVWCDNRNTLSQYGGTSTESMCKDNGGGNCNWDRIPNENVGKCSGHSCTAYCTQKQYNGGTLCGECTVVTTNYCCNYSDPTSPTFNRGNGYCSGSPTGTCQYNSCGVQTTSCSTVCTPTTCAARGKNCGTISDGCGGTLNCGSCTSPATCGGTGTANVCGGCNITVSPASLTVVVGYSQQLTATVSNVVGGTLSNVSWTSTNPSVASVNTPGNSTLVNGVSPGTTTVTATANLSPSGSCTTNGSAGNGNPAAITVIPPGFFQTFGGDLTTKGVITDANLPSNKYISGR